MLNRTCFWTLALALGAVPIGIAGAQFPPARDAESLATQSTQPSPAAREDPFATTERMQIEAARLREARTQAAEVLPSLRLKGLIEDGHQPPVALIEADGAGSYIVRPGDSLTLASRTGSLSQKVREVGSGGVVIETGVLKQVMVVR